MQKTRLSVLLFAVPAFAGGFFLQLGNPQANPEARKLHAVLTIQATGCHSPSLAKVTGMAIGIVNGERREIPLKFEGLSTPGAFALTRQWPGDGKWVIQLVGNNGGQVTSSLVLAGPEGVDRYRQRSDRREFTTAEVDAMLK
ncbi:MAG TPA: hypothetical protein VFA33_24320 [Bryobacteraceae bacterium]|nr:hypothetical protein [Bryobacteraceae bacterium]